MYLLFSAASLFLSVHTYQEYWFPSIVTGIWLLSLLFLISFPLVFIFMKEWKTSALSFVALVIAIAVFFVVGFYSFFMGGHQDHFGARHPIPEGLEYKIPNEKGIIPSESDTTTWILLQEDSQPGIYACSLSAPALPDGTISLDAYEVTSGFNLRFQGNNHDWIIMHITNHSEFGTINSLEATLYDGIWGEPYAVRLEISFTPEDSEEKQILATKVYKLEGWSR